MTTPYPFVAGQVLTAAQLNDIQNLPISDKVASYVLTVADVYKRTMMNSASATTITVNNSIFTVGDVIQVANKGAGTCTITAGVGVTINTSGSLALAQYGGGYLLCLSASTFTFFNLGTTGYGSATGGSSSSITVGGVPFTLLTFTTDGTLTVSRAGKFDIFAVGGGGGGGTLGGGGGGGGIMQATIELAATTYSVAIGVGGTGAPAANTAGYNGSPSGLASIAAGGGGGGSQQNTNGRNGGCGGGGGNRTSTGGLGFPLQGSNGGNGPGGTSVGGGGGGGASAVGANAVGAAGGNGGAGTSASTFTGGSVTTVFSGGGGGGGTTPGTGTDGGGNGTDAGTAGSGTAGRGGGGGGANSGTAGAGGSGIVYVRFRT